MNDCSHHSPLTSDCARGQQPQPLVERPLVPVQLGEQRGLTRQQRRRRLSPGRVLRYLWRHQPPGGAAGDGIEPAGLQARVHPGLAVGFGQQGQQPVLKRGHDLGQVTGGRRPGRFADDARGQGGQGVGHAVADRDPGPDVARLRGVGRGHPGEGRAVRPEPGDVGEHPVAQDPGRVLGPRPVRVHDQVVIGGPPGRGLRRALQVAIAHVGEPGAGRPSARAIARGSASPPGRRPAAPYSGSWAGSPYQP